MYKKGLLIVSVLLLVSINNFQKHLYLKYNHKKLMLSISNVI